MSHKFSLLASIAVFTLLSIALVACGDDDSDGPGLPAPGATPTSASPGENGEVADDDAAAEAPTQTGDDSAAAPPGESMAVVTVGDRRYEFVMDGEVETATGTSQAICMTLAGMLGGAGIDPEGALISLSIEIPPVDWETSGDGWDPPSVRIADEEEGFDWRAGGDVELFDIDPSLRFVGDYETDGRTASGTAAFVDLNRMFAGEEPESIPGAFEVSCPE